MDARPQGDDRPSALSSKCTADERSVIRHAVEVSRNGLRYFALRLRPRTAGAATGGYGDVGYGDSLRVGHGMVRKRKLVGPPREEWPFRGWPGQAGQARPGRYSAGSAVPAELLGFAGGVLRDHDVDEGGAEEVHRLVEGTAG
jgi:hypothetical protein